jgi:hypothetical protein
MNGLEEGAMSDAQERNGLTRSQIVYWVITLALLVGGGVGTLIGEYVPFVGWIIKELGPGFFTAGILAALVEPHFRREFARDAFLAAFRYVLPREFKEEVEKIIRFEFIAERQVWTVRVDRIEGDDETVLVTRVRTH